MRPGGGSGMSGTPAPQIIVAGDAMTDLLAALSTPLAWGSDTPARTTRRWGGSALNTAIWASRTGRRVGLAARVGDDDPGRDCRAHLSAAGVLTAVVTTPGSETGACVVLVSPDGERSMIPDPGANLGWSHRDIPPEWWPQARWLHVSMYGLLRPQTRTEYQRAIALARDHRLGVSVDVASSEPLRAEDGATRLREIGSVDLLLGTAEELAVLGRPGHRTRAAIAQAARTFAETVVVKCGPDPAVWLSGSGMWQVAPEPVAIVDSTGAGDAFAAGLLDAHLADAAPPDCLAAGHALAARAIIGFGGH